MTTLEDIRIESLTRENDRLKASVKALEAELSQEKAGVRVAVIAAASGVMPKAIADVVTRAKLAGTWKTDKNTGQFYRVGADGLPDIAPMGGTVTLESVVASLRQDAPHLWPEGDGPVAEAPPQASPQASRPVRAPQGGRAFDPNGRMVPRYPDNGAADPENPWTKGAWNITKQSKTIEADPAKALKLASAAGKPILPGMKVGEAMK